MKIIKSNSFFFLLAVFVTVYSACNQNDNNNVSDTYKNPDNVAGRVPETGSQQPPKWELILRCRVKAWFLRIPYHPPLKTNLCNW